HLRRCANRGVCGHRGVPHAREGGLRDVPRRGGRGMSTAAPTRIAAFDVATIKAEFPLLQRAIDGRPLHYLHPANTSQKPAAVIDAMTRFTETSYAPINRSAYRL